MVVTTKYVNLRGTVAGEDSSGVHSVVPDIDLALVPGGAAVANCFAIADAV